MAHIDIILEAAIVLFGCVSKLLPTKARMNRHAQLRGTLKAILDSPEWRMPARR